MSQQPEETVGLDLFDETASAAGSFPHAMLGYERQAVDAYIRDIERQLSSAKRKVRSLQKQMAAVDSESDLSKLGSHARDILRAAEAEAAELRNVARQDADRIIAEATSQAEALHDTTHTEVSTHRVAKLEDLDGLRQQLTEQTEAELAAARHEAQTLRDAAETHRQMVLADAERNAQALKEQAELEAEQVRQAAQRELAEVRAQVAQRHTEALEELQRRRSEVAATVAELTENARLQSEQFGANLTRETELMNERRLASIAHADQILADANEQAKATLAEARAAAVKREREAGQAEAAKVARLKEEIARLEVRQSQLRNLLKGLSTMASEFAGGDDDHAPAESESAPAIDEPNPAEAPEPAEAQGTESSAANDDEAAGTEAVVDHGRVDDQAVQGEADDATRVQPAVSGSRDRKRS